MRTIVLLIALFSFTNSWCQISNEDVIKMSKAGLSQEIILQKVSSEIPNFKTDIDNLINLKSNNVADTIINLMVSRQKYYEITLQNIVSNTSDGENYVFPNSGIYFKEGDKYTELNPTLVTSSRGKGTFSYKFLSQIEGSEANYTVTTKTQFYFVFDDMKKSLNSSNNNDVSSNYFTTLFSNNAKAVSPNEFRLVKLEVKKSMAGLGEKKEQREFVSGKINASGQTDMSIDSKYIANFKYEKVSENVYKVFFSDDIEPGQYCFSYAGNNNSNPYFLNQNNIKVYDFEIK